MTETKRNPAMDLMRCVALLCVMSVHFILYSELYDRPIANPYMYGMVFLRSFFMICVPLFLMLSGFLLCKAKLSVQYYTRIFRILITYCVTCIVCFAFQRFILHQAMDITTAIQLILSFSGETYGWYIEMYLGLFLLIPFLNTLYSGLGSRSHKRALILTLLFLTALPGVVNIYRFSSLAWWRNPTSSHSWHILIPDGWVNLHPLTYYFIGCYLREFPLKWNQRVKWLLCAGIAVFSGAYNVYRSHGVTFVFGPWQNYASLFVVAQAVSVFSLIQGMDLSRLSPKVCKLLQKISVLSLGAYLISWIPDHMFYDLLCTHVPVVEHRLLYFPLIVPAVFVCSMLLSAVIDPVCSFATRMILAWTDCIFIRKEHL